MLNKTITLYKESFADLSKDIWLLSFVMLVNRSGSMVIPFLSIYFTGGLEMTYTKAGILMTIFGLGTVAGQWLGGKLTDTIGYYPVQFWSLLISGFAYISLIFVKSFEVWCIAIFLTGIILDAFRPANMASIGVYSKPQNQTRSLTLIRLAVNLGFAVGPAAAGIISATMGFKWLFIIDGLTCIGAAILFRLLLENKGIVVKNESETVNGEKEEDFEPEEKRISNIMTGGYDSPYKDKYFMIFVLANLFMVVAFLQFVFTLPVYFEQHLGLSKQSIGYLLGLNGFLIFLVEMPIIYLLEQKDQVLKTLTLGMLFFVFTFASLAISQWAGVAVIAILLITFGEIVNFPFAATFALKRANPENRGVYMGTFGFSWTIGNVIAPILGMKLAEVFGFPTMWTVMACLCVMSMLGMWWLKSKLTVAE
jgi:MFS family permease